MLAGNAPKLSQDDRRIRASRDYAKLLEVYLKYRRPSALLPTAENSREKDAASDHKIRGQPTHLSSAVTQLRHAPRNERRNRRLQLQAPDVQVLCPWFPLLRKKLPRHIVSPLKDLTTSLRIYKKTYTMTPPLLTVVITTFNREVFLEQLLDCLLSQRILEAEDLQVLVCDNASSDGTPQIVEKYNNLSKNIYYIRNKENIGFAQNLASGIRRASGKYVWFLCDDDLPQEDTITRLKAILLENGNCNLFLLNRDRYELGLDKCIERNVLKHEQTQILPGADMVLRYGDSLINASSIVVNREHAIDATLRSEYLGTYCESLVISLAALNEAFGCVAGSVKISYREGNTNSWNIWWPVIRYYFMPSVIASSSIGKNNQDIVRVFVAKHCREYGYAFCYMRATAAGRLLEKVDINQLCELYKSQPHERFWYTVAFRMPRVVPRSYVLIKKAFRYLNSAGSLNPVRWWNLIQSVRKKISVMQMREKTLMKPPVP